MRQIDGAVNQTGCSFIHSLSVSALSWSVGVVDPENAGNEAEYNLDGMPGHQTPHTLTPSGLFWGRKLENPEGICTFMRSQEPELFHLEAL